MKFLRIILTATGIVAAVQYVAMWLESREARRKR